MDPTILADVADLEAKIDTLKTAQAAVAPLQATADSADAALAAGKQAVTTATADVDASFQKLAADVQAIEHGDNPAPPDTVPGGGGTPATLKGKRG